MNAAYLALPALLDELEAAREKVRLQALVIDELPEEVAGLHAVIELQREMIAHKDASARRMRLLGAAEKLEQLGCDLNYMTSADMKATAAQLRREAEK